MCGVDLRGLAHRAAASMAWLGNLPPGGLPAVQNAVPKLCMDSVLPAELPA